MGPFAKTIPCFLLASAAPYRPLFRQLFLAADWPPRWCPALPPALPRLQPSSPIPTSWNQVPLRLLTLLAVCPRWTRRCSRHPPPYLQVALGWHRTPPTLLSAPFVPLTKPSRLPATFLLLRSSRLLLPSPRVGWVLPDERTTPQLPPLMLLPILQLLLGQQLERHVEGQFVPPSRLCPPHLSPK